MAVMTAEWLVVIMVALWVGQMVARMVVIMVALWVGKMVAILVGVMAEKMAE